MENEWLEQDCRAKTEVSTVVLLVRLHYNFTLALLTAYTLGSAYYGQAEDTEELSVFRRQWQEELRRDTHNQASSHERKETEVQVFISMVLARPWDWFS